jgi:hypothetical protein
VSELRALNPSLLKNVAPEGKALRVPKGTGSTLAAVLDTIPAEKRQAWRVHRYSDGESLGAIARRYRVTERSIIAVNRVVGDSLEEGDLLIIPAAPVAGHSGRRTVRRQTLRHRAATAPAHKAGRVRPVAYARADRSIRH